MMSATAVAIPQRAFMNLDQTDEQTAFWARFLDVVHGFEGIRANHRRTVELLGVGEGFALLDVGCGTGNYARDVAPLVGATGRVAGIDASEAMIAVARERSSDRRGSIAYHVADAGDLPFGEATFDGCRTERVLQYLPDPPRAVAEMVRVTKPGGRIVATELDWDGFAIDSPGVSRDAFRRASLSFSDNSGNGWMGRELRRVFLDAGLVDVTCEGFIAVVTDATTLLDDMAYRPAFERARDVGRITPEEFSRLIAAIEDADRAERFCCGFPLYTVSGRKPIARAKPGA
jgi:ubiquinone/menaquinone biosynthesis C-methylase UbiE